MNIRFLTMADNLNHGGLRQLARSLHHFGWDFKVIHAEYQRFGSKQVAFYNYLKNNSEVTHAIIADAYDVFVLGTPEEFKRKLFNADGVVFNAERACWPYAEWAERYPVVPGPWKYLNGGVAFINANTYIKMFEENPITHMDNDQVNLADIYLRKASQYNFDLDTGCEIFQSIAFEDPTDFTYIDGRLVNNYHNTLPLVIHGNGKTSMEHIYKLIPTK